MRRLSLILLILALATLFLVGTHWYIADRLVIEPGWPEPWRSGLLALLACFGLSLVLQPVAERHLARPLARLIAWPASLWMGLAFYLLLLLGVTDALLWLTGDVARAAAGEGAGSSAPGLRAALVGAVAFIAAGFGLRSGLAWPQTRRIEITLARWPRSLDGFRIVQISDIHIGPLLGRGFAEHLVRRVNGLAPDLVAVTGDLVDGPVERVGPEVEPFAGLRARSGVYFVTGNHDHYSGVRSWVERIRELGIVVLRNERVTIRPLEGEDEAAFDLVGVDDHRGSMLGADGGEDLDRALEGRDASLPAVLLAHDPSTFKKAARRGIDFQLSGHTHGGQIWPFGWLVRLVIPTLAGRYERGGAQLYVSRGTGFWGPPMRLFAPAEITEIVLRGPSPARGPGLRTGETR